MLAIVKTWLIAKLTALWKPVENSIMGSVNIKEVGLAVVLALLFFVSGGKLDDFISFLAGSIGADVSNFHSNILSAFVTFIVAYLHRSAQKA